MNSEYGPEQRGGRILKTKFKYQWYQEIFSNTPRILEEARKTGKELGLDKLRDKIGLYPGNSSCPGSLPNYVLDAIIKANKNPILPVSRVEDELREVIKDVYGDEYDGAAVNTCESGLRVAFETLFAPPTMRKGDAYRGRFIFPYHEDSEFMASYGRPFPPRYKNVFIDRSASAGELGIEGKSLTNLDSIFVKLMGARYEAHGIKYNIIPLMTRTDAARSIKKIQEVAERHMENLVGFVTVGYDTPGYGYGEKNKKGIPVLKRMIGELAANYDLPFLVDYASALPIVGHSPADLGADVGIWSMDKAARAPISGLMVGKEEAMVYIRKGLGLGGQRYGQPSSHSKALFSLCDPGRDAVVGLVAVLKMLRDNPQKILKPVDRFNEIVVQEFNKMKPARFRDKLIITKSHNMGGTELNYEQTWDDGDFGIPIFSAEDAFANTNPITSALEEMGVFPATIYSGNIFLGPGLGTLDENADLNEEYARLGIKSLVKSMEIVCKHAGLNE